MDHTTFSFTYPDFHHGLLGLYRSLAREFTRAFRFVATNVPVGRGIPFPRNRDELAAQFELELDQYPGPMRLREYWRCGGFLRTGVLFPMEFLPFPNIGGGATLGVFKGFSTF